MSHKLLIYAPGHLLREVHPYLDGVNREFDVEISTALPRDECNADLIWVFGPLPPEGRKVFEGSLISRTLLHRRDGIKHCDTGRNYQDALFVQLDEPSEDKLLNSVPPIECKFTGLEKLENGISPSLLVYHGHGGWRGWGNSMTEIPSSRTVMSFSCRTTLNRGGELSFGHRMVLSGRVRTFFGSRCLIPHDRNKALMLRVLEQWFKNPSIPLGILLLQLKDLFKQDKILLRTLNMYELLGDPTSPLLVAPGEI